MEEKETTVLSLPLYMISKTKAASAQRHPLTIAGTTPATEKKYIKLYQVHQMVNQKENWDESWFTSYE